MGAVALSLAGQTHGQIIYDGVVIDQISRYDGYPVHLYVEGEHHIWFCAQSPITGGDGIYYSKNTLDLSNVGNWSAPIELFDITDIPFASANGTHVCDPTVLKGSFFYQGQTYSYAMYFTANTAPEQTGDNKIGVAFSNDAVTWTIHPDPVISPGASPRGSYGAGAGGVAWGPVAGKIYHLYRDSSTPFGDWRIRYKESNDALIFSPTPSLDTAMSLAAASNFGSAPEIAFDPYDQRWYGAIQSIAGGDPFTGRILRSTVQNDILGTWETIAGLNGSSVGEELLLLPSLAKNENSTLYVDPDGWIYAFVTQGNHPDNSPGVFSWQIGQLRYRLYSPASGMAIDGFRNIGHNRSQGSSLDGTSTELGGQTWDAASNLTIENDRLTVDGSGGENAVAWIPYSHESQSNSTVELRASIDSDEAGWCAIGFSEAQNGLFSGELWVNLDSNNIVTVFADGLRNIIGSTMVEPLDPDTDFMTIEMVYDSVSNVVSVTAGMVQVVTDFDLDTIPFNPTINFVGLHLRSATRGADRIDELALNHPGDLFEDGFESGETSNWSTTAGRSSDISG